MVPQKFKLAINKIDSLLESKTNIKYDITVDDSDRSVKFTSVFEGIDVLLKINRSFFTKEGGPVEWKYCADPVSDYWVKRNSSDFVSMTQDFHDILKNKMFDKEYLKKLGE